MRNSILVLLRVSNPLPTQLIPARSKIFKLNQFLMKSKALVEELRITPGSRINRQVAIFQHLLTSKIFAIINYSSSNSTSNMVSPKGNVFVEKYTVDLGSTDTLDVSLRKDVTPQVHPRP